MTYQAILKLLSACHKTVPNYWCDGQKLMAVVGGLHSETSIQIATILSIYIIPQLHYFLKNISFNNTMGDSVFFRNGELQFGFDIINWVTFPNQSFQRVKVGRMDPLASPGQEFTIDKQKITWHSRFKQMVPRSVCTNSCHAGFSRKVQEGKPFCCFDCAPCSGWKISAQEDTSACVFPFVFDGRRYSSCTMDGMMDEKLWCATTGNYDKDNKWKHCSLEEYGGNSNGKPCIFPFVYKNRVFFTCTDESKAKGRFWCSTTINFDLEPQWSYCADIRLDANPKGPCVFPFRYNGTSYSSCTTDGIPNKKPWCSLTSNYDEDLKWTYCEPSGPDESMDSPPCAFPFIYKGKPYWSCTTDGWDDGTFWCATTRNYDADRKWKFCQVSVPIGEKMSGQLITSKVSLSQEVVWGVGVTL
uniref:uncharacterized protein LOC130490792 n=1 Tax=Euleptes europaea TaxID=460621 RepID=UPI002541CFC3|nr:uncharacterized protein LOC130490792 [Euleptes europaea]